MSLTASSGLYENAFGSSFPRREDKQFIRDKVGETFFDPRHATDELVDECFAIVNDRNRVLRISGHCEERDPPQHGFGFAQHEAALLFNMGPQRYHYAA